MKTVRLAFASLAAATPCAMALPFAAPAVVRADFGRVVAVADFNRDGRAEVLMASAHDLVWMRHTTGTSFTQAATFSWAAATIDEVVARDIDGDGDMDVVLNTASPSQLIILRNDGNFVFTKPLEKPVGSAALEAGAIVGDYDNDGDLDAGMFHTVAGETVRRITWAANNAGTYTLQAPAQNAASISWLAGLTADFNQDGYMDLAMGETNVSISRGTPSGVFLPWPSITFSGSITHMEAGDIDRDGYPDLVLTSGATNTVAQRAAWCRWNGSGFNAPLSIQNHSTGRVRGTHLVDLDEDGDLDAIYGDQAYYTNVSTQAVHQILWAENSGGNFLIPKLFLDAQEASEILSGDVDGDGDTDVVYSGNNDIMFMRNSAIHRTAEFGSTAMLKATPNAFGDICSADMDNDGDRDLVWSVPNGNAVWWGSAGGGGATAPSFSGINVISHALPGARAVAAGDLNHDGLADLVVATEGTGQLQVGSRSSGNWQFTNVAVLPEATAELVVADVDLDGNNDILIGHATGVTLLRGNGGFTPSWTVENVVNATGPVKKICPLQLNGSGRRELIIMTRETNPVRCRIHRSYWVSANSTWSTSGALWEGDSASSLLAAGDANRDNATDIIYAVTGDANCAPSTITTQNFGTVKPVAGLPPGLRCAESADFDGDGIPDLAAAGEGTVLVATGKGDGTFAAPVTVFSSPDESFHRMNAYDLDDDGDTDIVVLDANKVVRVLYNNCGQFDLTELALGEVIPAANSQTLSVMHLTFSHGGRSGDAAAVIRSLRFRLRRAGETADVIVPGAGLTTAESTALISAVDVNSDNGEPMNFEGSGTDTLAGTVGPATSTGYLTVTLSAPVNLAVGQTVRLWVRVKMAANASSSPLRGFFLEHITDPATAGTVVAHSAVAGSNILLDPMLIDEASVRVILPGTLENWRFSKWNRYDSTGPADNYADPDCDGVNNLIEYYTGTDPIAADSAANAKAALTVLAPTAQSPVKVQIIASLAAVNDPRVRLRIEDGTTMPIWNNFASGNGTTWNYITPTIQTVAGRSTITFSTGFTPATKKKFFVRMLVEEL